MIFSSKHKPAARAGPTQGRADIGGSRRTVQHSLTLLASFTSAWTGTSCSTCRAACSSSACTSRASLFTSSRTPPQGAITLDRWKYSPRLLLLGGCSGGSQSSPDHCDQPGYRSVG